MCLVPGVLHSGTCGKIFQDKDQKMARTESNQILQENTNSTRHEMENGIVSEACSWNLASTLPSNVIELYSLDGARRCRNQNLDGARDVSQWVCWAADGNFRETWLIHVSSSTGKGQMEFKGRLAPRRYRPRHATCLTCHFQGRATLITSNRSPLSTLEAPSSPEADELGIHTPGRACAEPPDSGPPPS